MADRTHLSMDIRQGLRQFEERVDRRFDQVEAGLTTLDRTIDSGIAMLSQDMAGLRRDKAVQLRWTTGVMRTGFVAIVAAVLAG